MAFNITRRDETASFVTINERLWLNPDRSRVVADGDPDARFLLATPGDEMPAADAETYGLLRSKKQAETPANPDEDLKAAEWVELVDAAADDEALVAVQERYKAAGADFKTVAAAFEKRLSEPEGT